MFRLSYAALTLLAVSIPRLSQAQFGPRVPQSRSFRSRAHSASTGGANKTWTLADHYQGEDFLDQWDFFDRADPTHGLVNYQSAASAKTKHLAYVQGNNLVLKVDNTTQFNSTGTTFKRDSVRISSKKTYNAGHLFIADFAAMPSSCGVWPAWWSVGPSWPNGGEIDVLEGVHKTNTNKMTLHTSADCVIDRKGQMTGTPDGTSCVSSGSDNQGCGVSDRDPTSYGDGFNKAGGGVYAHSWTSDAIEIWHFSRANIPADILAQKPDPSTWPTPTGSFFQGENCDFSKHFQNHVLTIDTTICGDWAGIPTSLEAAHCPNNCAELVKDPRNFDSAFWSINSISVYN